MEKEARLNAARRGQEQAALEPFSMPEQRLATIADELDAAHRACDDAVEAEERAEDGSVMQQQSRRQHDASEALVYSNRAVVHWLTADASAAQADLARAQALAPQADFVIRNLAALRGHPVVPGAVSAANAARTSE